jgi:hypothetical protein
VIVALGSVRGSPGVTSWSLLLAAAWPGDIERVVLEADPDGGVLGVRYGLGVEPGAVSLLAAVRRTDGGVPVDQHGSRCGEVWVVPGPEAAEHASRVWASSGEQVADALADDERVWFVDAGRLHAHNPARGLADAAAVTVLLSGPRLEDLVQLPARVAALQSTLVVLVVGDCRHSEAELLEFTGATAVWRVDGCADLPALAGQLLAPSRARRSWLWRQAVDVASGIAAVATAPREAIDSTTSPEFEVAS